MPGKLCEVLMQPELVEGVLCKILTPNDDAGRHGVLIPVEAYRLFPEITDFVPRTTINYTEDITTLWNDEAEVEKKESKYKHYHRYPERRITRLNTVVNDLPINSLLIIARRTDSPRTYEIHVLEPDAHLYGEIISDVGMVVNAGSFFLDLEWTNNTEVTKNSAIDDLLIEFDKVNASGFIKTMRSGSTGVGYTFETLLGIEENNDSGPDYKGIELKCFRLKGARASDKMNLFLKEPTWIDGSKNMAERLERYGYYDADNDRQALFSTPTINENTHKFRLSVDEPNELVYLEYDKTPIAEYSFTIIKARLDEKLTEAVYIGAKNRGKGDKEEFHYSTLTYYTGPSIREFIALIKSKDVFMELRMRTQKNYGTCFRIKADKLLDLYARTERLRE